MASRSIGSVDVLWPFCHHHHHHHHHHIHHHRLLKATAASPKHKTLTTLCQKNSTPRHSGIKTVDMAFKGLFQFHISPFIHQTSWPVISLFTIQDASPQTVEPHRNA
jgi:hypothetical protein